MTRITGIGGGSAGRRPASAFNPFFIFHFSFCICSYAGPNADAILSVDLVPATTIADSSHSRIADSAFWVAVRVDSAAGLDTYGFELTFDTARLAFDTAVASLPSEGFANFLESRGGTPFAFIGGISRNHPARVGIANALQGSDSAQAPSGGGLLALIRFRPRATGQAAFSLGAAQLLDWRQQVDTAMALRGATLTLTAPPVALRKPSFRHAPAHAVLTVRDLLGRAGRRWP